MGVSERVLRGHEGSVRCLDYAVVRVRAGGAIGRAAAEGDGERRSTSTSTRRRGWRWVRRVVSGSYDNTLRVCFYVLLYIDSNQLSFSISYRYGISTPEYASACSEGTTRRFTRLRLMG
jgi:hypothetical protein